MRLSIFAVLSGLVALVGANLAPMPRAAHNPSLHQMSRRELTAREKHPDLFRKRQDGDSQPSSPPSDPCSDLKRRSSPEVEQVLTAREMASFLMGRGSFTSENGTRYVDEGYSRLLEEAANSHKGWHHRAYNVVKDSIGNKLLEISIPHYKQWKNTLMHGQLIYLSPLTAIRAQDIDDLERILVADPDFIDIQVSGFTISRRFFEVATSF